MRKFLFVFVAIAAMLFAGCSGPIYPGDQCTDDGTCTVKEQYLGGCADCVPDFEAVQDTFSASFYNSQISIYLQQGETYQNTIGGTTYTFQAVAFNADAMEVTLSINEEYETMAEGETSTVNGLEITINDIFITEIEGEYSAAVDFTVNANVIDSKICVKNLHGEYEGNVNLLWQVSGSDGNEYFNEEEDAYFSSSEISGNVNVDIKTGRIDGWSNLNVQDWEEWQCFQKEMAVGPSDTYSVSFTINSYHNVNEQNYDNNYAWLNIQGGIDPSEYLIMGPIGDWNFVEWEYDTYDQEVNGNAYRFLLYQAAYDNNDYAYAAVGVEFSEGDAESFIEDIIGEENLVYTVENVNGNNVYYFAEEDNMYIWVSYDKLVLSNGGEEILFAYLDRYPSTLQSTE